MNSIKYPACCDMSAPTYTEQHRHECETRYVAGLPSNERRADYLAGVAEHRGQEAAARLREAAWSVMQIQALDL